MLIEERVYVLQKLAQLVVLCAFSAAIGTANFGLLEVFQAPIFLGILFVVTAPENGMGMLVW
jgi:hypothetical protein